jgi:two-component system sensor histidine kinase/response regulator
MPNALKRLKQVSIFCFFMFFLGITTSAQTTKVDELLAQLNKNSPDTTQIKILRKLSTAYSAVDPVKKFYYANQFRLLAEKNGIDSLVASAYLDMGISYGIRSKLDSALYYFNLGYEKSKEINYAVGIARSQANIGYAYDHLDRKKEAVKNYESALKIFRKLNIKKSINQMITNLGSIYFDLGEYKIADSYFRQVLENMKEVPSDEIGLGNALFSLGNSNRKLGNPKKSMDYYEQSLAIREKIGDLNGIALSNWGIGQSYINKYQYAKALGYLEIALKNNRILKNIYQESVVLMGISHAYLGLNDNKSAEETANLAMVKAKESNSKGMIAESLELLIEVNAAQKKYDDALRFQADYNAIKDSLDTKKAKKDVIITDLNRINSDNKDLVKDNRTIIAKNSDYVTVISIITILLIIVAVLLALYYKRNLEKKATNVLLQRQKQEIAEVNEELGALNEELTTQMDLVSAQNIELEKLNSVKNKFFSIVSHDLRSPLNSLKMLFELYRKGILDEKELSDLLARLEDTIYTTASFLDNLLEWSKSQLEGMKVEPSAVEIHHIVQNNIKLMDSQINLKALKVENKIAIDTTVFADPNMINTVVRNLLSNAIKFCNIGDKITFDAKLTNGEVICSISDSGPGISDKDKENLFNLTHTISTGTSGEKGYHIGLILCKDMILQNKGTIQVNSELGKGTTFNITLPAKG